MLSSLYEEKEYKILKYNSYENDQWVLTKYDNIILKNDMIKADISEGKAAINDTRNNVVFRISLLPSNKQMKEAILMILVDSENLSEKNVYYIRAKFYTEIAMMFVHGLKGTGKFAAGTLSEGASGGAATMASGIAVAAGAVLV